MSSLVVDPLTASDTTDIIDAGNGGDGGDDGSGILGILGVLSPYININTNSNVLSPGGQNNNEQHRTD
ncbi:hypothetical protein [Streptomyces griseus]|uniref:hypothetical protein n=1 Tax=Streptomyces griseus TaxID=1911 RepID=UPI0033A1D267